jgi:hypothetical protein
MRVHERLGEEVANCPRGCLLCPGRHGEIEELSSSSRLHDVHQTLATAVAPERGEHRRRVMHVAGLVQQCLGQHGHPRRSERDESPCRELRRNRLEHRRFMPSSKEHHQDAEARSSGCASSRRKPSRPRADPPPRRRRLRRRVPSHADHLAAHNHSHVAETVPLTAHAGARARPSRS